MSASLENVAIQRAGRDDADAMHRMITALADATGHGHRIRSSADDLREHGFGSAPLFDSLIAKQGSSAVGLSLYFFTFSTWLGEPGVFVQDLYVKPALRGRGLGKRLLAATAAEGRTRGAAHLRLSVDASNTAARRFYERIGMQHRAQEDTLHIGGDAFAALAG